MRDTENIFDTSTTLLDIDEPPGGDGDAGRQRAPAPDTGGEPDYFTPNPTMRHTDARRRALAVLGLVGGSIFVAVLISAATGSGESRPVSVSKSPTQSQQPVGGRAATVVGPERAPKAVPQPAAVRPHADAASSAGTARGARRHSHPANRGASSTNALARRRHHHSRAPQNTAPPPPPPEPEPTYTSEPEPTYVPPEEVAPPPASSPSTSSPSGGGQQEFGIEP